MIRRTLHHWYLWVRLRLNWFWIKRVEQRLASDAPERALIWQRIHLMQLEAEVIGRRRS